MNEDMYLKSSLAATGSDNSYKFVVPDDADEFDERERGNIGKSSLIAATTFNYKINTRHKIETGLILTRLNFTMNTYDWDAEQNQLVNELSDKGHSSTLQHSRHGNTESVNHDNDQRSTLSSVCVE